MSTKAGTTSSNTRTGRSAVPGDKRRGRSRSPSHYLKKSGKSVKGFLSGGGKPKKSKSASMRKQKSAPAMSSSTKSPSSPTSVTKPPSPVKEEPRTTKASTETTKKADTTGNREVAKAQSVEEEETVYDVVVDSPDDLPAPEPEPVTSSPKKDEASKNIVEKAMEAIEAIGAVATSVGAAANPQDEGDTKSSKDASTASAEGEKTTMQLLLMEPKTRRFELLQLEFHPEKALVQDILSQVTVTATEDPLRTQEYVGICSVTGKEIDQANLLKDFVTVENEFAIAIPAGLTGPDVSKLAAPILQDPKIKSMFKSVLDNNDLPTDELPIKLNLGQSKEGEQEDEPTSRSLPQEEETAKESTPTSMERVEQMEKKGTASSSSIGGGGIAVITVIVALLAIVVPLAVLLQNSFTAPLGPGDKLEVGQWRSKCGFFSIVPEEYSSCHEMSLELTSDGVLALYDMGSMWNDEKTVVWKLSSKAAMDEGSILEVGEDGTVTIGGKDAKVQLKSDVELTPWPFTTEVRELSPRKFKKFLKNK